MLMKKFKKIIFNPFVQKWFFTLLSFFTVLFVCFMLYTRINSEKMLRAELTSYSELQTERISSHLNDSFKSYSRVAALLSLDNMINIYLFQENAVSVFPDIYTQINSQLVSYIQGFPAIDSIYLYPASQEEIIISSSLYPVTLTNLKDTNWLSYQINPDEVNFIYREKNGRYPYLATILLPVSQSGRDALIVLNINMSSISILQDGSNNFFQKIYIVSDNGEIIYRNFQESMPEALDVATELQHFNNDSDFYSYYANGEAPYIYVQQHADNYPWYYITITTPQTYLTQSYDFYGTFLSFLPWLILLSFIIIISLALMVTHPIRTISNFLEAPLTHMPDNISEPEVQKIIRQFINYIHTNQALSDELNHQMELQNNATYCALQAQINPHFLFNTLNMIRNMEIESLGYDHEVPDMTLNLSKLLQYAIRSTELVSLKTEFYYTDLYLKILNQRYKKALHFDLQKDTASSEVLMPKMILQPLVENAVFHGCSPSLDTRNHININATVNENTCIIVIKDDGIGIEKEKLNALCQTLTDIKNIPSNSIGLQNVIFRMHLTYGKDFNFTIDSEVNKGTCITLSFPA